MVRAQEPSPHKTNPVHRPTGAIGRVIYITAVCRCFVLKPGLPPSKVRSAIERWAAVTRHRKQSRVRRRAACKIELMSGPGRMHFQPLSSVGSANSTELPVWATDLPFRAVVTAGIARDKNLATAGLIRRHQRMGTDIGRSRPNLGEADMISAKCLPRCAALALFGACALAGLGGCAPTNAPVVQAGAQPTSAFHISNIEVNTALLLAQSGKPTAQWVQQALPGALAQAFAANIAPGDFERRDVARTHRFCLSGPTGACRPPLDEGRGDTERLCSAPNALAGDINLYRLACRPDTGGTGPAGRVQALSQSYWLKRRWGL